MTTYASQDAVALTREAIYDKVMRGQHLTAEEKEFVRNGYRRVERPTTPEQADRLLLDG